MKSLSNFSLFIVGWLASLFATAFTLKTLWGWFIVSTFNLPVLSLVSAMGLDLTISFLLSTLAYKSDLELLKDSNAPVHFTTVARSIFFSAFFLCMGYIVHLYM